MKIPLSFADQFYVLRDHIPFVGSGTPNSAKSKALHADYADTKR